MKKLYIFLVVVLIGFAGKAQNVTIPDTNFKNYLASSNCANLSPITIGNNFDYLNYTGAGVGTDVDTNNDGEIQQSEALAVTSLSLGGYNNTVTSIQGIEAFTNVKVLFINLQNGVQTITLDGILPNLQFIRVRIQSGQLNPALDLKNIILKNLPALQYVDIYNSFGLQSFNFENLPLLEKLNFGVYNSGNTPFNSFALTNLPNLDFLNIQNLNLNGILNLSTLNRTDLDCTITNVAFTDIIFPLNANKLTLGSKIPTGTINFSSMNYLKELILSIVNYTSNSDPVITSVNYGAIGPMLDKLTLNASAGLSDYNFSTMSNLTELTVNSSNPSSSLLFNGLTSLTKLTLYSNNFANMNNLDYAVLPNLNSLNITGFSLASGIFTTLNYNGPDNLVLFNVDCYYSIANINLGTLNHVGQLIIKAIPSSSLALNFNNLTTATLVDFTGNLPFNSTTTINNHIDVAQYFKLVSPQSVINGNNSRKIVFANGINTPYIYLKGHQPVFNAASIVTYLKLDATSASPTAFATFDLTLAKIDKLEMYYSGSSSTVSYTNENILFSAFTDLKEFYLTSYLSITPNNTHLLKTLDFNQQTNLNVLNINMPNGKLEKLLLKNGKNTYQTIYIKVNTLLKYICYDEDAEVQQIVPALIGVTANAINFNTYCTFDPGGLFYTIQGTNQWDSNNNGCDANDSIFPNFSFNFTNGVEGGRRFADSSGQYHISLLAGTYTLTPFFENPQYYDTNPSNFQVTLGPSNPSVTQDFCISPLDHQDLLVYFFPLLPSMPGFDSYYKVVYVNNGNIVMPSGQVTINYSDALLHLISANPIYDSIATNQLTWNFTNLQPYENRSIYLVLHLNSPTQTPPVNSGNILVFNAVITPIVNDAIPSNNTFDFHQIVINSFDPNDKTCTEGTTISPSMVGDYVHYIIRFENEGTANAQNIVVKDMIDTSKFDVNTLMPISGSHSFETRISDTNKVEFIFQNINLPFASGTNSGYVAFKIKTKPTLVVGDTFSNTANIYFDYNFPIVTNTATTTIAALAMQDFDFGTFFSVYPNPAKQLLNLETKATINVKYISIYNLLGQMVIAIPNAESVSTIDVSDLKTGTYFIKVNTDKGTANTKFIKE